MPHFFFSLMQFYLRVDGVVFRTIDTRIFHEYDKDYLIRECQTREAAYQAIKSVPLANSQQSPTSHLLSLLSSNSLRILLCSQTPPPCIPCSPSRICGWRRYQYVK